MNKTMKEIADDAERRWEQKGYTEGQKQVVRYWKRFVISREKPKTYVNRQSFERRLELDHVVDKVNERRNLKEVWDE